MNPERFWVEAPQITFPEASVVRAFAPEQLWTVETLKPPARTSSPRRVLVALLVWRMEPPEIVSPEADESPPADDTLIPPANVDVAVEEDWIGLFCTRSPPKNSDVLVVEVAVMNP